MDDFWFTKEEMAVLLGCSRDAISHHLEGVFISKELDRSSTVKETFIVSDENIIFKKKLYNWDAAISVAYRVKSKKAMKFRQWTIKVLREFFIKGFALDDERLKQGKYVFSKTENDEFDKFCKQISAIDESFHNN